MSTVLTPSVSGRLAEIAGRQPARLSVGEIVDAFGDRAFGAMAFVFAAPLIFPMPPGVSAVLGLPLIFITAQWMLGRRSLWIPRALARRTLGKDDFAGVVARLIPHLQRVERRMEPRMTYLYSSILMRLIGAICFVMAVIVFLPIPFGNMMPALTIAIFALGASQRDGLAALLGWATATGSIAVLALLAHAALAGLHGAGVHAI